MFLCKRFKTIILSLVSLILALSGPLLAERADLIFLGDNIITMDDSDVNTVAVLGDRIIATGLRSDILRLSDGATRIVELGEKALLPGFIDAHGHFSAVSLYADLLDLSSPRLVVLPALKILCSCCGCI